MMLKNAFLGLFTRASILACKWIESGYGIVPMEFEKLINNLIDDNELKNSINKLLWRKKEGQELDREPKIAIISNFIESELELLKNKRFDENNSGTNIEKLDQLFRWVLKDLCM